MKQRRLLHWLRRNVWNKLQLNKKEFVSRKRPKQHNYLSRKDKKKPPRQKESDWKKNKKNLKDKD